MGNLFQNLSQAIRNLISDPRIDEVEPICRNLRKEFHGHMLWEADERFRAVLSPFGLADVQHVRDVLKRYFPIYLTYGNETQAPERIHYVFHEIGNLTPDKELYVLNPEKEIIIYAALWPWEDKRTATLRIGFVTPEFLPSKEKSLFKKFKTWFGMIVLD